MISVSPVSHSLSIATVVNYLNVGMSSQRPARVAERSELAIQAADEVLNRSTKRSMPGLITASGDVERSA